MNVPGNTNVTRVDLLGLIKGVEFQLIFGIKVEIGIKGERYIVV